MRGSEVVLPPLDMQQAMTLRRENWGAKGRHQLTLADAWVSASDPLRL